MKQTHKIYFHAQLHSPDARPVIAISDADMSKYGFGFLFETREVETTPPSRNELIAAQVALLEAERAKVYAEAATKGKEITERLERFLAITNSPTEPAK